MKSLPEGIAELDPNLRWLIDEILRILQEVVREPWDPYTGELTEQEAKRRIGHAVAKWDRKAEEAAISDYLRIHTQKWLRDFAEKQLLFRLYERAALRKENSDKEDRMRPPSGREALRLATALLDGVRPPDPLNTQWEAAFMSSILAGHGLFTYQIRRRARWREYIRKSRKIRVYFDALRDMVVEWTKLGLAIPTQLARWWREVADGRRTRPDLQPIQSHRPANPAQVAYEMHLQFTIELLDKLGMKPRGKDASGCRIVAEALTNLRGKYVSEDAVVKIWNRCPWRKSFLPTMRQYSEAIAIRMGLYRSPSGPRLPHAPAPPCQATLGPTNVSPFRVLPHPP